jgi:hypothetical protein
MPAIPKVYFSYAWGDGESPEGRLREEAASYLYAALKEREGRQEVEVVIDRERMNYKSSIRQFTKAYGHAEALIILIISEKYLQSEYCMGEVVQILSNKDYRNRIFPVVLPDAGLQDPLRVVDYHVYWEERKIQLAEAIDKIKDKAHAVRLLEMLKDKAEVIRIISEFTTEIRDIITVSPPDYQPLLTALDKRIQALSEAPDPDATPPSRRKSLHHYHAYTCDRVDQRDRFLLNFHEDEASKVHWYYLYGDNRQAHDTFYQRLGAELAGYFDHWEGNEQRPEALPIFEWIKPPVSKIADLNVLTVLKALFARFFPITAIKAPLKNKTIADLLESPKLKGLTANDHVMILIIMDDANWDKEVTPQSVEAITKSFLRCELPPDAPRFFFFFGIEYSKDKPQAEQRRREVDEAIRNSDEGRALPELLDVSADDITEWFSRYRKVMLDGNTKPEAMTKDIFGTFDTLPMEVVVNKLIEHIEGGSKDALISQH